MKEVPNFKWEESQDFDDGVVCTLDKNFTLYAADNGCWCVYNQDAHIADGVCKGGGLEPAKFAAIDAFCGYLLDLLNSLKAQFKTSYFG